MAEEKTLFWAAKQVFVIFGFGAVRFTSIERVKKNCSFYILTLSPLPPRTGLLGIICKMRFVYFSCWKLVWKCVMHFGYGMYGAWHETFMRFYVLVGNKSRKHYLNWALFFRSWLKAFYIFRELVNKEAELIFIV